MHDLRTTLRPTTTSGPYCLKHTPSCTSIVPATVYVNRFPASAEFATQVYLGADRYSISWRCGADHPGSVQRCDLFVFLGALDKPAMTYDLRARPEFSVAFHLPRSGPVCALLRVQCKTTFRVHALHVMLARDHVVGFDPLMYEWDMGLVSRALTQQQALRTLLGQFSAMFEWDRVRRGLDTLFESWQDVFRESCGEGTGEPSANAITQAAHYQHTLVQCRLNAPELLVTSKQSLIGSLHCDERGAWTLRISGVAYCPTYTHPQYFIWCFPEKQFKLSLRRDVPQTPHAIPFTVRGDSCAGTPVWYWLGYNFLCNLPFYNLWSAVPCRLEFVKPRGHARTVRRGRRPFRAETLGS